MANDPATLTVDVELQLSLGKPARIPRPPRYFISSPPGLVPSPMAYIAESTI
jgi:hypothetical protein